MLASKDIKIRSFLSYIFVNLKLLRTNENFCTSAGMTPAMHVACCSCNAIFETKTRDSRGQLRWDAKIIICETLHLIEMKIQQFVGPNGHFLHLHADALNCFCVVSHDTVLYNHYRLTKTENQSLIQFTWSVLSRHGTVRYDIFGMI